jgi:uncharacterized protein YdhG (YjbR/CyaY superfamily)
VAFESIDEYIATFPPDVRAVLKKIRATIRKAAPAATEKISYQMPAFALDRDLVYFAAFRSHIGFYPPVKADGKLKAELAQYANEKGNLRFPLDEPIPYGLIGRIVRARIKEVKAKSAAGRARPRATK